ncbi:MAG TPA: hypothetical protein VNR37_00065 [Microbacteriaceae bacterium]|nr:hypothetical protein [Microbacteriaceae bacterium]
MDQSAFYGIVSAVNFTLLGLWWVAVKDRPKATRSRTAYLVGLNFAVLATISLFAQVAPEFPIVWRLTFGAAGIVGLVAIVLLARDLRRVARGAAIAIGIAGVVLYAGMLAVAVLADLLKSAGIAPIQAEAFFVCAIAFLGVQVAWVVGMSRASGSEA